MAVDHAVTPLPKRTFAATRRRVSLSEIWSTRRVAWIVGRRDMRIKYKQSILGPLWLLIQPLGMLAAVCVAFAGVTQVDTGGIPYILFALVGITIWTYTQLTVSVVSMAMVSNPTLVRRSACPRVALVNGALITNLPTLLVMTVITLVVAAILEGLRVQMLALPLVIAWLLALIWGPGLLLASVAARFRDAIAVVPMLLQAGLFLSPVGYPIDSVSGALEVALSLNPLSGIIEAARWAVLGTDPAALPLVAGAAWTLVLGVIGWRAFGRLETGFADYL